MYGLECTSPVIITGLLLIIIYSLKFLVAWGFYKGIHWVKNAAVFDVILGMLVGFFIIFNPIYFDRPIVPHVISSDLFFLIPYLIILLRDNSNAKELVIS